MDYRALGLGSTALLLVACLNFDPFACTENGDCNRDGLTGACSTGWCSYPDAECPSNFRFDEHAGGGLANECVGEGMVDTGNTDGPTSTTQPSSSTTGPTGGGETETSTTVGGCGGAGEACCDLAMCDPGLECMADRCGCVEAVEAGRRHTCALKVDGTVWCWGENTAGQVGVAMPPQVFDPVMVMGPTGPNTPGAALAASNHTCVRRTDGVAFCWGGNNLGQSDPGSASPTTPPTQVTWSPTNAAIATGLQHSCTIPTAGGTFVCWGDNANMQLTTAGAGPGPITAMEAFTAVNIALGGRHSCSRDTLGATYCWGNNQFGQLGADPMALPSAAAPTLVTVPPVNLLAAGDNHTCAILAGTGEIQCWGRNNAGQVGDGTGVDAIVATPINMAPISGMPTQIVAGPNHTCTVTNSQQAYCWGSNNFGQLRLSALMVPNDQFTLDPVEMIDVGPVAQITTGETHTCVLEATGAILCWGANGSGQIGDGTNDAAIDPTPPGLMCP